MASKTYRFTGKVNWARIGADQLDTKYNEDGEWKLDFFPDNVTAFKNTGIQTEERKSEEGSFFKLRRSRFLSWRDKSTGERMEKEFAPASVTIRNDSDELSPFTSSIGNGSKVILTITVFDTRKGKGHRFEHIEITDLVRYENEPEIIGPDTAQEAVKKPVNKNASKDLDDEIPF